MPLPRSVAASLVVATVAWALLQLESSRMRRVQERAIIARTPLAETVTIEIPAPGAFRLTVPGDRRSFPPLELRALSLRAASNAHTTSTVRLAQGVRRQRHGRFERQALATITFDKPGRYEVGIDTRPPATAIRGADLLVAQPVTGTTGRGMSVIAALTAVIVLALLAAAIGVVRALRERLSA